MQKEYDQVAEQIDYDNDTIHDGQYLAKALRDARSEGNWQLRPWESTRTNYCGLQSGGN